MAKIWIGEARRRLLGLGRDGRWGYRAGSSPASEPTALAALALLATEADDQGADDPGREAGRGAGAWLASTRNRDGSIGVSPSLPTPGWPTPLVALAWAALGGFEGPRAEAGRWLLASRGTTFTRDEDDPVGHDPTLVGWPWVESTHSWVEPTAMAMLALSREGQAGHPRVVEGVRVLRDRAIATGGWNLGNPIVFRTALRPFPAPSGLALLALAAADKASRSRSPVVAGGLAYLARALPETLAPASLGWGVLGLGAWGVEPPWAADRLASAYGAIAERRGSAVVELSLLLLAAGARSLDVLGCPARSEEAADA